MIKLKTVSEMVLQTNIVTVANVKLKYVFPYFHRFERLNLSCLNLMP